MRRWSRPAIAAGVLLFVATGLFLLTFASLRRSDIDPAKEELVPVSQIALSEYRSFDPQDRRMELSNGSFLEFLGVWDQHVPSAWYADGTPVPPDVQRHFNPSHWTTATDLLIGFRIGGTHGYGPLDVQVPSLGRSVFIGYSASFSSDEAILLVTVPSPVPAKIDIDLTFPLAGSDWSRIGVTDNSGYKNQNGVISVRPVNGPGFIDVLLGHQGSPDFDVALPDNLAGCAVAFVAAGEIDSVTGEPSDFYFPGYATLAPGERAMARAVTTYTDNPEHEVKWYLYARPMVHITIRGVETKRPAKATKAP